MPNIRVIHSSASDDDDHPTVLEWTNVDHEDPYTVTIYRSKIDGVAVVQIDTPPSAGRFRIDVNDGTIWSADPDSPVIYNAAGVLVNPNWVGQ